MSTLSPEAKALIGAASGREPLPSDEAVRRLHRSVLARAACAGATVAIVGASSAGAKAAVVASGSTWLAQLAPFVAAGAVVGAVAVASVPVWMPLAPAVSSATSVVAPARAAPPRAAAPEHSTSARAPSESLDAPLPAPEARGGATILKMVASPSEADADMAFRESTAGTVQNIAMAADRASGAARRTNERLSSREDLALQLELLRTIRAELAEGRPGRVLEILDAREAVFRGAVLEEQARIARVAALCHLGRATEARAEAVRISARWPSSSVSTSTATSCISGLDHERNSH